MTATDPVPGELPDLHTTAGKIADLERRRYEAVHAGSAAAVDKQHAKGKLTARERIALLLDEGSFTEFDELARHRAHGYSPGQPYDIRRVIETVLDDGTFCEVHQGFARKPPDSSAPATLSQFPT
jgi:propionyl-CoA carboxylase beta chain